MCIIGLTVKLFLLFLFVGNSFSFPENLKPKLYLTEQETSEFPVFSGQNNEGIGKLIDVQDLTFVGNKLLITARNAVYVLSRYSLERKTGQIPFEQILYWFQQNETRCDEIIGSELTCQNYIRVVAPLSPTSILLCGTNAARPNCREYEWDGSTFTGKFEDSGKLERYKVPSDQVPSLVYKYSGGYMFTATSIRLVKNPAIIRTPVTQQKIPKPAVVGSNPPLPTLTSSTTMSNTNPYFVGMAETSEKMFIFFREEAIEASDTTDKVVYSRVAQVCKKDEGGSSSLLKSQWTSFFKARLNCSIPGSRPFYFNEIQDVTETLELNGKLTVFATFTTPRNSIAGSAVCAYTMFDIAIAMAGSFKEQSKTSWCWNNKVSSNISPHPTVCGSYPQNQPSTRTLQFIEEHPIMDEAVQMLTGNPIFTQTQGTSRFTALTAETNILTAGKQNVTVLYIGTTDGKLLKVVSDQSKKPQISFTEEWNVFQPGRCTIGSGKEPLGAKRVRKVTLVDGSDAMLVTFKYCVISLPKQVCQSYACKSSCVSSGNPYCGWLDGKCVPVTSYNRDVIEQDLFSTEDGDRDACLSSKESSIVDEACSYSTNIVLPLTLGLIGSFTLVLLIFCIAVRYGTKNGRCSWLFTSREEERTSRNAKNNEVLLTQSRDCPPPLRVSVEATLPLEASLRTENNNSNHNVANSTRHVVQHLSSEETTWSDDIFETGTPSEPNNLPNFDLLGGAHNSNNNKTIGVAHPIKHPGHRHPGKLSQIVEPMMGQSSYGSINSNHQTELRNSTPMTSSRIMTNPNYLPISPFLVENENFVFPKMETFSPDDESSFNLLPGNEPGGDFLCSINESDSMGFPPPPSCAISPSSEQNLSSFANTSWRPSPPDTDVTMLVPPTNEKTPLKSVKESTSGDSTTSGFVSCSKSSSQSSFKQSKDKGGSRKNAFIVAKGILSAQSIVGSKKKKISCIISQNFADDVFEQTLHVTSPVMTSQVEESSDEDFEEQLRNFPATPGSASSSEEEQTSLKEKKTFFKRKRRKDIMTQGVIVDEESFISPAYDEDPVVPQVEGWEEIEYSNDLQRPVLGTFGRRSVDDSYVKRNRMVDNEHNFCTIRPKNRLRKKSTKNANNLVPVPTPNVPL